jgi:ABC-type transport system involved in cytochrome bd biosynthesis fused ATPase/permease subunit
LGETEADKDVKQGSTSARYISLDRMIVIDQGQVVEQGTHGELLRKKGAYHRLDRSQFHPLK